MSDLDQFESQLQAHFNTLAAAKRPNRQPMFVLEHCLDASAVREMRDALGATIRNSGMNHRFKHCWLVHAAEHGYTFEGLEYWHSFAELTPQWNYYGDRDTLRSWFVEFAERYNGVRPSGRWGQHYRFIAWPITHALLPTDLQAQLAEVLYHLRYRLDELIGLEDSFVGSMLARHVEWPSKRFKHFLDQHELAGRVVRALLEETLDEPVIYLPTLERITNDLNAKSQARAWLQDARKYFHRFRTKLGTSNPCFSLERRSHEQEEQTACTEMDSHGVLLQLQIELRRLIGGKWDVQLLVPCFHALVNLKPGLRNHLARVRYSIPAHGNALFLGQSLLSGRPVPRKLTTWPQDGVPLLRFNQSDIVFDRIVNAECQLSPAKLWIFLCVKDDLARHIEAKHVRAGHTYIVVSRDAGQLVDLGDPIDLDCADVFAVRLEIPQIVGLDLSAKLNRAQIAVYSRVQVEPVGLRPRQWDGTGTGEWLSTETPLFALTCDLDVHTYQVELNRANRFEVPRTAGLEPTLIALRNLPVGCQHVSISAFVIQKSAFGVQRKCVASAEVDVYIRHPSSWTPRTQLTAAMVADVFPAVPCLDDFLKQRMHLRAEGDTSRVATCSLVITNSASNEVSSAKILSHRLPIAAELWKNQLRDFLKKYNELQLFNGSQAEIVVDAEDLGSVRIPLLVEQEPLRWALRRSKSGATLFLVDEGVMDSVSVTLYEFEHPLSGRAIDIQNASNGIDCRLRAGLYVARAGMLSIAIAVASEERAQGLAALGAQMSKAELSNENSIAQLLEHLKLWSLARAGSYMAMLKQHSVCTEIRTRLLVLVCGNSWLRLENALDQNSCDDNWRRLEGGVGQYTSFAISLAAMWRKSYSDTEFDLLRCLEVAAKRFKISADQKLIEIAWQFASASLDVDSGQVIMAMASECFGTLVRGARLLVLCRDKKRKED